ncbi:MAG TPA: energy transducer TonB [Gemmatimonadaceae bacterium]|nr:energy transducer TonB [Gemmatimonadaceae bacterium]
MQSTLRAFSGFGFRALACLVVPSVIGAQQVLNSAWLEWTNLQMAIAPDSGGTYLWVLSGGPGEKASPRFFSSTIDPRTTVAWISDVRRFLSQPLTDADSGAIRSSPVLLDMEGSFIYVARRRLRGTWSRERILVMEARDSTEPVMVSGDEQSLGEILDSLDAVSARTILVDSAVRRDSIARVNKPKPQKPAEASPRNRPPPYPDRARADRREGTVLLSFDIGEDGKADMRSIKVIHSPGPEFVESVLKAMPRFSFTPASLDGRPVRSRVVMPFTFALMRR